MLAVIRGSQLSGEACNDYRVIIIGCTLNTTRVLDRELPQCWTPTQLLSLAPISVVEVFCVPSCLTKRLPVLSLQFVTQGVCGVSTLHLHKKHSKG